MQPDYIPLSMLLCMKAWVFTPAYPLISHHPPGHVHVPVVFFLSPCTFLHNARQGCQQLVCKASNVPLPPKTVSLVGWMLCLLYPSLSYQHLRPCLEQGTEHNTQTRQLTKVARLVKMTKTSTNRMKTGQSSGSRNVSSFTIQFKTEDILQVIIDTWLCKK